MARKKNPRTCSYSKEKKPNCHGYYRDAPGLRSWLTTSRTSRRTVGAAFQSEDEGCGLWLQAQTNSRAAEKGRPDVAGDSSGTTPHDSARSSLAPATSFWTPPLSVAMTARLAREAETLRIQSKHPHIFAAPERVRFGAFAKALPQAQFARMRRNQPWALRCLLGAAP